MRKLFTKTQYRKLDDRIYLICTNCGHCIGTPKPRTMTTAASASCSRPDIFRVLTWSATAANHKIQKLSKHWSKFQTKVDSVLHPSNGLEPPNNSTTAPFRQSSSYSLQDPQEHQHLLSVNNVHVAVVHNLNLTRGQIPKRNNVETSKINNQAQSPTPVSNTWRVSSGSRHLSEFELEQREISKSLDIFELMPLNTEKGQRSPGVSDGATVSPQTSRSSSWTSAASGDVDDIVATSEPPCNLSRQVLEDEPELRQTSWFHGGIPREIALEILKDDVLGSFIVRESSSRSGCFALSVRVPLEFQPSGIAHYLIIRNKGYKIKGFTKEFSTLTSLITHHSVMPELLPCPLYRRSPLPSRVSRADSADFAEPEKLIGSVPAATSSADWTITEF